MSRALGGRLGLPAAAVDALDDVYERWDGLGLPFGRRGEELPLLGRAMHVAEQAVFAHADGGRTAACAEVARRAGGHLDPDLAAAFLRDGDALLAVLDAPDMLAAVVAAEPGPGVALGAEEIEGMCAALAVVVDLKGTHRAAAAAACVAVRPHRPGGRGAPPHRTRDVQPRHRRGARGLRTDGRAPSRAHRRQDRTPHAPARPSSRWNTGCCRRDRSNDRVAGPARRDDLPRRSTRPRRTPTTSTDTRTNAATVADIYAAFGRGDIPSILDALADDVAWEQWSDNVAQRAQVPYLVPRRGPAEVAEFFTVVGEMTVLDFAVLDVIGTGRQVVAEIRAAFALPGGGRFADEELHLWAFDDSGKVTRFRHHVDTAKHIAAGGSEDTTAS